MLKVGLIGCGFMGNMHANCYKNIDGVTLAAVADIRKDKAESIAEGTDAVIFGDGMDLIMNADLDIIDICLPTFLHAKYALAAMEKVKYLFIEKPVTLTVQEGEELIAKSRECGCNVQIGQVIRFWDEYVALKEMVDSNKYGKIVNANFRRLSPRPDWGWNNWLLDSSLSGGAGQDLHIHDIDFVFSLLGKPNSFYSIKNVLGEEKSYVNTIMQYDTAVVSVEGTWDLPSTHPFEATFRVVFENAVVENAGGKFMLYTTGEAKEIVLEKTDKVSSLNAGGNISDLGGYFNELLYFCNCAIQKEPIKCAELSSAVDSLKFLKKELDFNA